MKTYTSRFKVSIYVTLLILFFSFGLKAQTFNISDKSTTSIELSFSTSSEGVIILHSSDGSFTDPNNGTAYTQGNTIGSNEVVYVGNTSPTSHSSLTANTHYYYRAWEYDASNNYTLIDSDDDYTLKYAPTYHATNFLAVVDGDEQISLSWTDASGLVSPDHYLIKASSVSYADITAPVDGTAEADDILVKNIAQGIQTAVFTGLDANTTYYFKIYPYTNSGDKVNYKTSTSTLPTEDATTELSASSDIIEQTGFSYAQNIDYISEVGADVTDANTTLWGLTIRDGGASADDNDLEPTILNDITISITNHSYLNKIAIYDGTKEIQEVAAAASVSFTGLGLQANDDGTKDFQIKATYNTSITDNEIISFSIESANLSADAAGSDFGTFATISSSTVSPNNQLEVDAIELSIIQQPTNVYSDYAIDPAVTIEAVDANGNRDLDYTTDVTTSVNAGSVTLSGTNTATPISGLATFDDIQFSDGGTGVTLDFNSTGLSSATSNTFDVTLSTPEIQISEGATILDAADGTTDVNFGDVEWGTTSTAISLTIENIGKAELTITTPVNDNGDFAVSTQPTSPVNAGNSTTIGIEFTPSSAGSISGKITVNNNDDDEGSFVINLEGNGTLNQNSSISASSFNPTVNIDYLNYLSTDLSASLTDAIKIAEFTLTDGPDDDNASTILTDIEIGISNFDNLNRIAIYDGSTIYNKAAAATVSFSGLNIEATDNSSTTFEIYASFNTTVTDNEQIQLTINSVTADATGSNFTDADGGGAQSPIDGDDNRIEVEATKLVINSVDNPVDLSTNFNLSVQALDANDNLDLDETSSVTLALSSGSGILSSATSLTQYLSSGEYSWTDVQYDTEQTFVIEAKSVDLANDLSGNINVNASSSSISETPVSGQISSQTISSLDDTDAEAVDVFRFNITDDGNGNGKSTDVTNIRIKADVGNNINWTDHIQDVIIDAAGVITSTSSISSNQIDLSIVSGNLVIADGASREITISVYLNTSNITDNGQLQMFIDSDDHGFTAEASGSGFASAFNGDINSNIHTIEVEASELSIITQPTDVYTDYAINPDVVVEAVDANGNRDLDYAQDVDVVVDGTPTDPAFSGSATTTVTAASGLATFDNILFSSNSSSADVNLLFSSTGTPTVSSIQSTAFEVIESLPEINIKQNTTTYLTASTFNFSNTEVGISNQVDFVIENTGQKVLNISSSSVSGSMYSLITSAPASIAANSSAIITVAFDPTAVGNFTGTLTIDHDDVTGSEDPYIINLGGDGIPNNNSSIIASSTFTYNENIDYSLYQSTDITSNGAGSGNIQLGEFTIQDGPDGDVQTTTLTAISFNVSNSSNLNKIAIVNGSSVVAEQAAASTVSFSGLSITTDTDEGTESFKVYASFNSTVTDNDQIQLTISSATAATGSSGFADANAGGDSSSIVGDDNRLVVEASEIVFTTYPASVDVASNFTIAVEAIDANGNRDLDQTSDVTLSKGSGSGSLTNVGPTAFSSGYVEFTTVQYDNEDDFSVDAIADAPLSQSVVGALITTNRAEQLFASAPTSQIAANTISSVDNDEATESLSVFKFDLTDDGSGSGDNSVLTNIRIIPAASNTADWADAIQGVKLNDGNPISIGSPTITSTYIDIPLTGGYTINDGSTVEITMDIYLNQTDLLVDGEVISLMIDADNHNWTDDGSGSALKTDFGSDVISNDFTIDVEASELNFVTVPSSVTIGNQFTVEVEAVDAHGNRDTDVSSSVTIAKNTGTGDLFTSNYSINLSSGIASWTDLEYNIAEVFKVDISHATYTTIISDDITANDIAAPNSPSISIDYLANNQIQISITKPSGSFGSDWDGYLVFARESTSNNADISSSDFGDFTANATYGSGSPRNNSYCVAKVSSDNDLSTIITGLTRNEDYYFVAYAVKKINGAANDKWSAASTEVSETADLQGVSTFAAITGDAQANLSWANYSGAQGIWWDEIMVIAKLNSAVTYGPSGDGSAYTANSTYTSGNDLGSGQYVVYKGTSTSVNVTGLNNGETYYFRTFVRRGNVWTDADQYQSASATPSGGSGNVIITEVADYLNDAAKSYVEIYNAGSSSVNINGWQLNQYSPNASVSFSSTTQKNSAADFVLDPGEYALIVNSDWSGLKSDYGISDNVAIFVGSSVPAISGGQYYDLTDGSAKASVDEFGSSTTFSTTDEMSYERNAIPSSDGTQEESWSEVENTSYGYTPAGENNNPLPVEIINFYAEFDTDNVIIKWATASEENNDYFIVYKSVDAETFSELEKVYGNANSKITHKYTVIDNDLNSNIVYYKLKQVDFDGKFEFTDMISVETKNKNRLLIQKAYFDGNNINLLIKTNTYDVLNINIYSIDGKLLNTVNKNTSEGLNNYKINTSKHTSIQAFIIEIKNCCDREVIKIINDFN